MIDVAIVGAGPAGLAAGVYATRAGFSTTLFEGMVVGGQLTSIDKLENYPGFPEGVGGFEIAFAMREQAERFGSTFVSERVEAISETSEEGAMPLFTLRTASGEYQARAVILAMGAKPRQLPVPGLEELTGRGVSYCATCDGNFFRGKEVIVVGGGDTACADAIYLSRICPKVHLAHRRDELRASPWYAQRLESLDNVEMHWNTVLTGVEQADGVLASVALEDVVTKETQQLEVSGAFIAVGTSPDTAWLEGVVDLNESGYVITHGEGETSRPGIFAAGDTRTTPLRQVVTAVSDGALAAEAAAKYLASW